MKKFNFIIFTLTLFISNLFLPQYTNSNNNILSINSPEDVVNPLPYSSLFLDKSNSLTFEDIDRVNFISTNRKNLNFGFIDDTLWVKFAIQNLSDLENWILDIPYPPLDKIEIFLSTKSETIKFISGDSIPFNMRNIKTEDYGFKIKLQKSTIYTIMIKVKTSSSTQLPIKIVSEKNFYERKLFSNIFKGAYIGIFFVMIFYNLFIYITVRDKTYILYITYMISILLFFLSIKGFLFKFLFSSNPLFNDLSLILSVNSITFFGTLFGLQFLNIKKYNKLIFYILTLISLLSLLLLLSTPFINKLSAIRITALLSSIASIFLLLAGIVALYKGYKPARYYVFGWLTVLIGTIILVLNKFGVVPQNIFTENSLHFGSVIEVIFLSISLGARIKDLKDEKDNIIMQNLENRLKMNQIFEKFVPKEFLKLLGKDNLTEVKLGDNIETEMTILFCDIRNFTSLSENMTVDENFRFLNSFFMRMNPIIHKNNGVIDKFIGDSIMGIFHNDPLDAVNAGVEMLKELTLYNENRKKSNYKPIKIGIGINCGKVMLGTVGSEKRMNTTVIGDTVNIASRLETITKTLKSDLIISEYLFDQIKDRYQKDKFIIEKIGENEIIGRKQHIVLYKVVFDTPTSQNS